MQACLSFKFTAVNICKITNYEKKCYTLLGTWW